MTIVEMAGVYTTITPPATAAYRFGLFSVVPPTADAASAWEGLGVQWTSQACTTPGITYDPCVVDVVEPLAGERYCTVPQFDPFTVYELTESNPRNAAADDQANRDRLAEVEQFAVEAQLWNLIDTAVAAPVAAGSIVEALAYVEQALVEAYPARGVIHVNRFTGIMLGAAGVLVREGSQMQTTLGTPVSVGGGYGAIGDAVPDNVTIFGTGPIVLQRGPVDSARFNNLGNNEVALLAHRTYAVGWDCAAVGATAPT